MGSIVCLFVNRAQGARSRLPHSKHARSVLLVVVRREAANTQGWPALINTTEAAFSFNSLKEDIDDLK